MNLQSISGALLAIAWPVSSDGILRPEEDKQVQGNTDKSQQSLNIEVELTDVLEVVEPRAEKQDGAN